MAKKREKERKGVLLRIPESLKETVLKSAKSNKRSLNGEIEYTLTEKYL